MIICGTIETSSSSNSSGTRLHCVASSRFNLGICWGMLFSGLPRKSFAPQIFISTIREQLWTTCCRPISVTSQHHEISMLCRFLQLLENNINVEIKIYFNVLCIWQTWTQFHMVLTCRWHKFAYYFDFQRFNAALMLRCLSQVHRVCLLFFIQLFIAVKFI